MTKDKVQERLTNAKAERQRLLDQLNMMAGVIGDCEYWLAEFNKLEDNAPLNDGVQALNAS